MYMKASENVEMGCDVTPEIPPLAWALSDSLLSSRCSACFSKLINYFHCTGHCGGAVIYCSQQCRDTDIRTHLHSGECHLLNNARAHAYAISTSDLRAAVRLLFLDSSLSTHSSRISNLMTNHDCLLGRKRKRHKPSNSTNGDKSNSDCEEFAQEIEECARVIHLARKHASGAMECDCDGQRMEEEALCAVITNGVQVQLDQLQMTFTGVSEVHCLVLGTAVYGSLFSWCNHSCRPNASYRFVLHTGLDSQTQQKTDSRNGIFIQPSNEESNFVSVAKKTMVHGPGVLLRTIRRVSKGEEIFITYTDLMQPK
ncbi:hypothetical protein KI387_006145, partial [Taxus chinensis]